MRKKIKKYNTTNITNKIPVIIVHTGYKKYLEDNLKIASLKNEIYLIGDDSLKKLNYINNLHFISIDKFINTDKITKYKKYFVNYSSNNYDFEFFCFVRVFIINMFLKEYNKNFIFHCDSDNLILHNIDTIFKKEDISYNICLNYKNNFRMSCSIHNGLINSKFCDEFEKLYEDIYINKSKFNLIEKKIKYHKEGVPGGICDMTLYYLLNSQKIINIVNLNKPIDNKVFINNFNTAEGWENIYQYEMENKHIKIYKKDNKNMIYDIINNKFLELINIHFQGNAKIWLNTNWLNNNLYLTI